MNATVMLRRADAPLSIAQEEQAMLAAACAGPSAKVRYIVAISTTNVTRREFAKNPTCAHCGQAIASVDDAAFVMMPPRGEHRVAHRGQCLVLSVLTGPIARHRQESSELRGTQAA